MIYTFREVDYEIPEEDYALHILALAVQHTPNGDVFCPMNMMDWDSDCHEGCVNCLVRWAIAQKENA